METKPDEYEVKIPVEGNTVPMRVLCECIEKQQTKHKLGNNQILYYSEEDKGFVYVGVYAIYKKEPVESNISKEESKEPNKDKSKKKPKQIKKDQKKSKRKKKGSTEKQGEKIETDRKSVW